MTTNKFLLVAASAAAFLGNFALAQQQQPQTEPSARGQVPGQQEQQPPPPTQNGGWRRFGGQQTGNQVPPPYNYDQQQQPMQGQPQPYPPMVMPPPTMTLPAGTWVKVHIDRVLSSNHSKQGDPFTGTLAQPLIVNGFVIAHRGQNITGRVTAATKAGRVKGTSELALEINELAIADGQQVPLKSQLVEYHGPTSRGDDAVAIATTTGLGAAIGAAVNGGVGAGVGAGAGLLTSLVGVMVTRGRPVVIDPEALLTFKTSEPVNFSTERSAYAFQPAGPQDYAPALQTRNTYGPRPVMRPYGWGYPSPYYSPYPYFGTGIFIGGGRSYGHYGRRW